jgi:hypothetical protein
LPAASGKALQTGTEDAAGSENPFIRSNVFRPVSSNKKDGIGPAPHSKKSSDG